MKKAIKIKERKVGEKFNLIGLKWMIVEITDNGYKCKALEKYGSERIFAKETNNWSKSELRTLLNTEVYEKIAEEIGAENILEFERDLIAVNGSREYGRCKDKVSIISFDEKRKYIEILQKPDDWEWTLTPWGTKATGWKYGMAVLSPSGYFDYDYCNYNSGACPFCIFSSSIFKS